MFGSIKRFFGRMRGKYQEAKDHLDDDDQKAEVTEVVVPAAPEVEEVSDAKTPEQALEQAKADVEKPPVKKAKPKVKPKAEKKVKAEKKPAVKKAAPKKNVKK